MKRAIVNCCGSVLILTLTFIGALFAPTAASAQNAPGPNPPAGNPGNGGNPGKVGVPLLGAGPTINYPLPPDDYLLGFAPFAAGDFTAARRMFQETSKSGIRILDARWIDSVCYHTMIGECAYQMGDLVQALDQHTAAIKLFLANADWMLRVDFPVGLDVAVNMQRQPITWGNSARNVVIGNIPEIMQSIQGKSDAQNAQAVAQGGLIAQAQAYRVRVPEIARCIAVSIRRRGELLGPTAPHDPVTNLLIDALSRRLTPPNHWSQCWIDAQLGLALLSAGKPQQAVAELQKSLAAGGRFEHKLSGMALVELGKLSLANGQYENALTYFMEATYSASVFAHYDVMEEAFRGAVIAHLASGKRTFFAPLQPAILWAKRLSPMLEASLCVLAGDNCAAIGETVQAMNFLAEARRALGRHDMLGGAIGARFQYEFAKANFQTGNMAAGQTALGIAATYMNSSSRWLFQINLANSFFGSGAVTERSADLLFTDLLREPTSKDWLIEPFEAMAISLQHRRPAMENWFEVVMQRREAERALQIADRIRRQTFYSSLPLGGRTLALRWIMSGPPEALGDKAVLQRRDLLARYPRFEELGRAAQEIRTTLTANPLAGDDADQLKLLQAKYDQWGKLTAGQEVILHDIALEREPAEMVFPPSIDVKEFQSRIPPRILILSYFSGARDLYGFALAKDVFATWKVDSPTKLKADLVELLRKTGLRDRTQPLEGKDLRDDSWRTLARKVLPSLTNHVKPETWNMYDELVVVPDGPLWYLPFEMLIPGEEKDALPLLQQLRVRYVPTVSLALPDRRPVKAASKTAVVAGRLHPREELSGPIAAVEQLGQVVPDVTRLPNKLPAASTLVSRLYDRLVVYHDMEDTDKSPYEWSPVQIDRKTAGGTLSNYLTLPWGAPSQVVFPGYHTAAEVGLKKPNANGDEVFLSACGLLASGTRTALISRWRVGGQSSYDLTREFVQELPHATASKAWQRSVQLRLQSELDPATEQRLKLNAGDEPIRPEHPFFWAGYMLIDTGSEPNDADQRAAR